MDCAACVSCRLGVSSATGRLRWCVPEKDSSRRFRFVITAIVLLLVLLAISTVIVVRLSGLCNASNSTSTASDSETTKSEEVEGNVLPITLPATETGELEKRRLPYMTTEFVPPLVQPSPVTKEEPVDPSKGRYRQRRTTRAKERERRWDVVLDQADSDVNEEFQLSEGENVEPEVEEEAQLEPTDDYENLLQELGDSGSVGGSSTVSPSPTIFPEARPTVGAPTMPTSNNQTPTPTMPTSNNQTPTPTIPSTTPINTTPPPSTSTAEAESVATTPTAATQNNAVNIDPNHAADMNLWGSKWNAAAVRNARAHTMLSYMDLTANPCKDFYQYACGNWVKRHTIPADKAVFDTFEMLRESLDAALRRELEIPTKPLSPQENNRTTNFTSDPIHVDAQTKARYLYQSCMNHDELARRGSQPLLKLLGDLGGWPVLEPNWTSTGFDWLKVMARLRLYNNDILVSEWVGPDIKNSEQYVIQLDQATLGLPSRDYFLVKGTSSFLSAYKEFIQSVATILGAPPKRAEEHAEEIVNFEKDVARIMSGPEERRNVSELYTRLTVGELSSTINGIDWTSYLSMVLNRNISQTEPVVVFAIPFLHQLVDLVRKTPSRTIADYMLWRFVRHRTNQLDDRFTIAKQRLYRFLFGRETEPQRWKTCVASVNSHMGMALGSIFVQRYFDQTSKEDTVQMTKAITTAFREMLSEAVWMDGDTRRLAVKKLDAMQLRIGYPDYIVDREKLNERFKGVEIRPDRFFENTLNILQHVVHQEQLRLGTAVNKSLWNTAPAVVNAYYSRNKNQIMFPAGILQPPFYNRHLPRSLNFGGIGVVIGHEMTHGFDDKGRLFDEHGNLRKWWDEVAVEGFRNRAQCLVEQYGKYKLNDLQLTIDGENTQGENIADNSGVKQAFRVYNKWLQEHGPENETLPGVPATPLQLFFLNFAQVWCGTVRPQAMRSKMKTAVHAPGPFRVVGTLSNLHEFSEVFNCSIGSPMNPRKKCSVW